MALRLVRKISETPNITNKDDTIMTRYAYGGYNGVVKAFGSECGYTADAGIFKVLDGRIVVDGWEIDIDGAGWNLNLSTVNGIQYHSVFVEITIATESIKLSSSYLTGAYPDVSKGDDLTKVPNGTSRLLLYNVKSENGTITEVVQRFEVIKHIKERLEELGFKQGNLVDSDGVTYNNAVSKVGYYAIVKLENFNITYSFGIKEYLFTLPNDFIPKTTQLLQSTVISVGGAYQLESIVYSNSETNTKYQGKLLIRVKTLLDGSLSFQSENALLSYGYSLK